MFRVRMGVWAVRCSRQWARKNMFHSWNWNVPYVASLRLAQQGEKQQQPLAAAERNFSGHWLTHIDGSLSTPALSKQLLLPLVSEYGEALLSRGRLYAHIPLHDCLKLRAAVIRSSDGVQIQFSHGSKGHGASSLGAAWRFHVRCVYGWAVGTRQAQQLPQLGQQQDQQQADAIMLPARHSYSSKRGAR